MHLLGTIFNDGLNAGSRIVYVGLSQVIWSLCVCVFMVMKKQSLQQCGLFMCFNGQIWSSMAQWNTIYQSLDTQTVLGMRIHALFDWLCTWDLATIKKNTIFLEHNYYSVYIETCIDGICHYSYWLCSISHKWGKNLQCEKQYSTEVLFSISGHTWVLFSHISGHDSRSCVQSVILLCKRVI